MEDRSHAVLAGLFVVLLGLAGVAALWWFSDGREPTRLYELYTRGNVTGLNLEAQVRYRGMQAGRVAEIAVDPAEPRNLLVTVRLRADIQLTRGTRASLGTQGVTGLAFVLLEDDGSDPRPLQAESGRMPRLELQPSVIEQIAMTALETMQRFRAVGDALGGLTEGDGPARLKVALQHLESAAVGLDRTLEQAPRTLETLRTVLSSENLQNLTTTLDNLQAASAEATPAMKEFRQLVARMDAASQRVDGLVATTGSDLARDTLPRVDQLISELAVTTRRLGTLVSEVQQSPQLLLLGRGASAPGPGERGFEQRGEE